MSRRILFGITLAMAAVIAAGSWAADGDRVSAGTGLIYTGTPPKAFILCDQDTGNVACGEFDIWTKVGNNVTQMQFTITSDSADCDAGSQAAINVSNEAGGRLHLLGTVTQTAETFFSAASTYRYVTPVISGTSSCSEFTLWGVFQQ